MDNTDSTEQPPSPPLAAAAGITTTTTAAATATATAAAAATTDDVTTDEEAIMEAAIEAATDSIMELSDMAQQHQEQEQQPQAPPQSPPTTTTVKKSAPAMKKPPTVTTTTTTAATKASSSSSSKKATSPKKKVALPTKKGDGQTAAAKASSSKKTTSPKKATSSNKKAPPPTNKQNATSTAASSKKRKRDGVVAPQPQNKKAAPTSKSTSGSSSATTTNNKKKAAASSMQKKKSATPNPQTTQTTADVAAAVAAAAANDNDSSLAPPPAKRRKLLCEHRRGVCYTCYGCAFIKCEDYCTCKKGPNKIKPTAANVPPREKSTLPRRVARDVGDANRKRMIEQILLVDDKNFGVEELTPMRRLESVEDVIIALNLQKSFPTPTDGKAQFLTAKDRARMNPEEELPVGQKRRYAATKRAFEQGIFALAAVLYPEHPQHLVDSVLRTRESKFQEALLTVYEKSPKQTTQARTARAILVSVMPRAELPQFRVKARQSAHREMQALRNGEILPTIHVFPPTLSAILEEILQQQYSVKNTTPKEHFTDEILDRFKKHPSVKDKPPSDLPSDECIKRQLYTLRSRIKKQRDVQNPLPIHVAKLLEEWIQEDTSATKESLLERIKQQLPLLPPPPPPPPPAVQPPVHQLVDNNNNNGGRGGNGQNSQQQQQEEEQPWSLPVDEIFLNKIQALQDAVKTRLATFPKEIARRIEEWLIVEPLATSDELLARVKQNASIICQGTTITSLPADTRIKQKVGQIRSVLKYKWDLENPFPQRCYTLLKDWIGKHTDTPAQTLLDRLLQDPSMDQEQLAALPSLEVCLKKVELLRDKEIQQQRAFPKDASRLLEHWLLADKSVNNDTLIERLRRDPSVSQADIVPLDDKRIRKKLEHIRHKLKGKL